MMFSARRLSLADTDVCFLVIEMVSFLSWVGRFPVGIFNGLSDCQLYHWHSVYRLYQWRQACATLSAMKGKDLKKRRQKLELTQEQLAQELSVDRNTIARWERDERAIPTYLDLALKTVERESA